MESNEYTPFETLRPHFDALARVAYFKIVLKTLSPMKRRLYFVYRVIIWIIIVTYNLQHIIRVVKSTNIDEVVNTLFILLTIINTLAKQITFNIRSSRIEDIVKLVNGPEFALTKPYHVTVMRSNGQVMAWILKFYHSAVGFCGVLWTIFPIVNRLLGEDDNFTGYIPFDTGNIVAFGIALVYMSFFITFQAYGNVTMDCLIVALYSQARTQIQIFKHNMENLTHKDDDGFGSKINEVRRRNQVHKDEYEIIIQKRFVRCVMHHKGILWFVAEIQSIFGEAMVLQFLVMAWVICMTVYKIAGLNILSAEFVSMAVYLICMMAQLFIYCYFGSQLTVESEFLNRSLYCMDWLSLSPRFRRQLILMMQYCSNPIALRTAYIIPMSLDTYIKVLKSSYTLFTFLNR